MVAGLHSETNSIPPLRSSTSSPSPARVSSVNPIRTVFLNPTRMATGDGEAAPPALSQLFLRGWEARRKLDACELTTRSPEHSVRWPWPRALRYLLRRVRFACVLRVHIGVRGRWSGRTGESYGAGQSREPLQRQRRPGRGPDTKPEVSPSHISLSAIKCPPSNEGTSSCRQCWEN